jgi:hypothetical protein
MTELGHRQLLDYQTLSAAESTVGSDSSELGVTDDAES